MVERIVGIDLGTTHTVVAWCDVATGVITDFAVEQLVTAHVLERRPLLPSCLYAPLEGEAVSDDYLRFATPPWVTGELARRRAAEVPLRGVVSAKSWLCHPGVDRAAPILPWGQIEDEDDDERAAPRVSPVEASARVLTHVKRAWDRAHEAHPLAEQDVVLTVPASFDEVARELTVAAAERAGLRVRLLEEPQAAFYALLARPDAADLLAPLGHVLVVDVGGGTTDFSLLRVRAGDVSRVAVGDHLLLGGDNMDLAVAHLAETRLGEALAPARFAELTAAARAAKETLLGETPPDEASVAVLGGGARLVGGARRASLARAEVEALVLDGFFPEVEQDARPERARGALVAFGLPYARDPAVTRHLAAFLGRAENPVVSLVLNGGVFHAPKVRARVQALVSRWQGADAAVLPHGDPDRAVARGAVAYGLALAGKARRIGSGAARAYYVSVGQGADGERAVCVVPRGAEPGVRHRTDVGLSLLVGRAARFDLLASDAAHQPGDVTAVDAERFHRLPPLATMLPAEGGVTELPIVLEGELTDVGTLDLACVEKGGPRRFHLAFALRPGNASAPPRASLPPRGESEAATLLTRVLGKPKDPATAREVKDLGRDLERVLGERATWSGETARTLFDVLLPLARGRKRSPDHEQKFWSLAGWTLRPGFGHAGDEARAKELAPLLLEGPTHAKEARVWQQLLVAFRRVAGGLDEAAQLAARDALDPHLAPDASRKKQRGPPVECFGELLALLAHLERVPAKRRAELGERLIERTWTRKDPRLWDAIGRIGARAPTYASAHYVVLARTCEAWLGELLRECWPKVASAPLAAYRMARVTDDRARDVREQVRLDVARRLEAGGDPLWARAVREHVAIEEAERVAALGDALPPGLRLPT